MTETRVPLTYEMVRERLLSMPRFAEVGNRAAHFALDQIKAFLHDAGDFSTYLPAIHVAGTNGKGTVCSMLAAVYTQAGYRTGLYTSPHLLDVRERFRIDGEMMSEADLVAFFEEMDTLLQRHPLTFFELTTVIAFWYFNRKGVDIAIIETGLGGRLDATNVITPMCSVITSIGLDHMDQLGSTLKEIAREKAGILKRGVPFVTSLYNTEPFAELLSQGCKAGAYYRPLTSFPHHVCTDVPSTFEKRNIDLVYTVVKELGNWYPITDEGFMKALSNVRKWSGLQGRMEQIGTVNGGGHMYFDGSHNADALDSLKEYLSAKYDLTSATVVVAMMKDKLSMSMQSFMNTFQKVYFVELNQPRACKLEEFRVVCPDVLPLIPDSTSRDMLINESKTRLVLFTGSFYFYSVVSEWMGSENTTTSYEQKTASH